MSQQKTKPNFKSLARLRSFYKELSAASEIYITSFIRVEYKDGGKGRPERVIHDGTGHVKLKKKGHMNARRVHPVNWTDHKGEKHLIRHVEYTCGVLYAPLNSNTLGGSVDFEWALILKIDGDLARQKTGDVDDALVHYLEDIAVISDPAIQKKRERLSVPDERGRPIKSNSADLLDQYGDDPEAASWIRENRHRLNRGKFYHEQYRDTVLRDSISIEEFRPFRVKGSYKPPKD
jgi:hypothetical protein